MPVGRHSEKRVNLNEKHEREAYVARLAKKYEHEAMKDIIETLVYDSTGMNDPYKFRMVRVNTGLYVPHGSLDDE